MITERLTDEQLSERVRRYENGDTEDRSDVDKPDEGAYKFVRPLSDAANNLIKVIRNKEGRILFGATPDIDVLMRGIGKGELCYIVGYTTSGKTQLFLNIVRHNADKAIVLFTMDEPAEMVLAKLIAMDEGWDFKWVEEQVRENNQEVISRIRRAATDKYSKLIVVDQNMSVDDMSNALREAERFLNVESIDLVGIDYLRLLDISDNETDGQSIPRKSTLLKQWTQREKVPVLCLHQGSRGKSSAGKQLALDSMEYGGEQEAHFIIGVRRLLNDEELDDIERQQQANTVNVSLLKSKRLPVRIGEFTYYLHPVSGVIRPMHITDLPERKDLSDF